MEMKGVNHLTPRTVFNLRSPMWFGGKKKVGLDLSRVSSLNEIHFSYRRKSDGELSIPDTYFFEGRLLRELDFEHMNTKGVTLVLIPFEHLQKALVVPKKKERWLTEEEVKELHPNVYEVFFNKEVTQEQLW